MLLQRRDWRSHDRHSTYPTTSPSLPGKLRPTGMLGVRCRCGRPTDHTWWTRRRVAPARRPDFERSCGPAPAPCRGAEPRGHAPRARAHPDPGHGSRWPHAPFNGCIVRRDRAGEQSATGHHSPGNCAEPAGSRSTSPRGSFAYRRPPLRRTTSRGVGEIGRAPDDCDVQGRISFMR